MVTVNRSAAQQEGQQTQIKGTKTRLKDDVAGNVNESEDDAAQSQGGGLEPDQINVANNDSEDSDSPFKQNTGRKGLDDDTEIVPNNTVGAFAKSMVAEAQVKAKIVQRRQAIARQQQPEQAQA